MADLSGMVKGAAPLVDDAYMAARGASKTGGQSPAAADGSGNDVQIETALDPIAAPVNTVGQVAGATGLILGFGAPIVAGLGWLVGKIPGTGAKKVGDVLGTPHHYLEKESKLGFVDKKHIGPDNKPTIGSDVMNASFVAISGVETFNVAKSYLEKSKIRQMIRADMAADRKARGLSSKGVEGSSPLVAADNHIAVEHILRFGAAATGLFLNWRQLRTGKFSMVKNMLLPMALDQGVNMLMGENALLEAYVPFSQAQKRGQLSQQDYASFIHAISKEVSSRGELGKAVAMEVAKHYKETNASAGHILNDMGDGTFKALIRDALKHADAGHGGQHGAAQRNGHSHVDALRGGKKKQYEKVGHHTGKLHDRSQKHSSPEPEL
jgi:hypothetical protein